MFLILLLAALLLTGCAPGNLQGVVKEMAKSDRSWCLAATGFGVNVKIGGSGVGDGDMSCSDGGLTLKSQGAQIGVPMTIVPQMSIGQPTLAPPAPAPAPQPGFPQPGQRFAPRPAPQSGPAEPPARVLRMHWSNVGTSGDLSDADIHGALDAIREMHGVR